MTEMWFPKLYKILDNPTQAQELVLKGSQELHKQFKKIVTIITNNAWTYITIKETHILSVYKVGCKRK